MTTSNNQSSAPQLFDLSQRAYDGAWLVWIRKSPIDLGMVNRQEIESIRGAAFTDAEWTEFAKQPHFTDATVPVIAATYSTRPSVDTVLALLGVKRRQPANNNLRAKKTRGPQSTAAAAA